MKPFFKYSGGKRKEAPVVDKLKPASFDTFYEPFLGGGAIWLHLDHPKNVVNDNYPDVINFYNVLKDDTIKFVSQINALSNAYKQEIKAVKKDASIEEQLNQAKSKLEMSSSDEEKKGLKKLARELKKELNKDVYDIADRYYYHYRDNEFTNSFDQAISFYLMRQLSFSGMLRFSSDGKFNIPYGWYKSFKGIDQPIEDIKKILGNSTLMCGSWKDSVATATSKDFVFLDPPYTRTFTEYHPAGQFGDKEHEELADWFKNTEAQTMIIINRDEFTESLYKDYIIEDYDYRYSIQYRDRMTEKDSNAKHFVAINNYEPTR
jgi:DNA adenine methylase